jgi:hypothetical protein
MKKVICVRRVDKCQRENSRTRSFVIALFDNTVAEFLFFFFKDLTAKENSWRTKTNKGAKVFCPFMPSAKS